MGKLEFTVAVNVNILYNLLLSLTLSFTRKRYFKGEMFRFEKFV